MTPGTIEPYGEGWRVLIRVLQHGLQQWRTCETEAEAREIRAQLERADDE